MSSSTTANQASSSSPSTTLHSSSSVFTDSRAAILASLSATGTSISATHQHLATDLHRNAAALAQQERALQTSTADLAQAGAKLQRESDRAAKRLKQVGDVQNWAEMLERDFLVLEHVLGQVEGEAEQAESASGGSQWRG